MGSRRVDDRDSSLDYSGCLHCDWFQLPDIPGAFEGTLTATKQANATVTFSFEGTGVSVYGAVAGPGLAFPWGTSHYIVDNDVLTQTSLTPSSGGSVQQQIQFYQSPLLSNGQHKLVITNVITNRPLAIDFISVTNSAGTTPLVGPSNIVIPPMTKTGGSPPPDPTPTSSPSSTPPSSPPSLQESSTIVTPGASASPTGPPPPSSPTSPPYRVVTMTNGVTTVTTTESVTSSAKDVATTKDTATKKGAPTKKGSTTSTSASMAGALSSTSTSTAAQTPGKAKHGTHVGAVIGGVVAALLLLAAALALFFYIRRKRRARAIRLSTEDEKGLNAPGSEANSARSSRATLGASVTSLLSPTDTRWRASFESTSTSTSATSERTFKGRDVMFRAL